MNPNVYFYFLIQSQSKLTCNMTRVYLKQIDFGAGLVTEAWELAGWGGRVTVLLDQVTQKLPLSLTEHILYCQTIFPGE